jgi:hypothetical protein
MRRIPVPLYRMGNSISARMNHVREKDVESFDRNGELWVSANSGGVSTFSIVGRGNNWWRLDEGIEIPAELRVVNDYGNHYLWEPSYTMRLEDYLSVLSSIGELFYKVN